jgi:hypothetical protein
MDGRRASELTRLPDGLPRIRRQPRPLPRSWALALGAGWPLVFFVLMSLAPPPADPNAVPSLLDSAVFLAVMVGLFGTIVAAIARRSTALVWSPGLAVVWAATTIACPLSGHHDAVGWQWYAELASSGSLLLLSLIGIGLLRAHGAPASR